MKDIKKLYYGIGEVAQLLGVEPHVLRYWEGEFKQLKPKKNRAGNRTYTESDLALLKRIRFLLREEKYTIEGAQQILRREATEGEDVRQTLVDLRAFLARLLQNLS